MLLLTCASQFNHLTLVVIDALEANVSAVAVQVKAQAAVTVIVNIFQVESKLIDVVEFTCDQFTVVSHQEIKSKTLYRLIFEGLAALLASQLVTFVIVFQGDKIQTYHVHNDNVVGSIALSHVIVIVSQFVNLSSAVQATTAETKEGQVVAVQALLVEVVDKEFQVTLSQVDNLT